MDFNEMKGSSNELYEGERQLRLQHRFLVLRKLGQGTYGKVQLALNKETNKEKQAFLCSFRRDIWTRREFFRNELIVAVKTIKKGKIENEEDMRRIRREIHIMTSVRHPHIIHINEVFETRQKIVIAMQYASGGELYDYLGCHQTLPEDEARRIFRQIASAIYYCHKNRICHRDLKLENILLDEEGNAKIADFGLSNIFDDKRRMNTFCGSPLYASPEIVKGTPYKGPEVDCWSLGVLLYTLVYGTMPFDGRSFKELVTQISEGRYEEPANRSNASSLIRWLLTPDISQRATITDVCKDCWINQGYDTSLLEVAENMAMAAGLLRRQKNASKVCLETNTKNGREKSIFGQAAAQIEEKFPSVLTKSFENVAETNVVHSPTQKSILYEQIIDYDVRSVLNKLIAAVEATLNNDIKFQNCNSTKDSIPNLQKKEFIPEKVDTAYVIPIFEVTSVIPNERDTNYKILKERSMRMEKQSKIPNGTLPSNVILVSDIENNMQSKIQIKTPDNVTTNISQPVLENNKRSLLAPGNRNINTLSGDGCQRSRILLTDSQKQYHSLDISGQSELYKPDFQKPKKQEQDPMFQHPSPKTKRVNDGFPFGHKLPSPFMRTKHHVLSLARLLSLNYERLMRNSFKVSSGKKKPPGKIAIPPTFDPNNPPTLIKKSQEDKKELLILPTVSVSENKEKIEKKIEKIKKAALDKNIIIRSDSKTRLRIEKYIRSQVKKIHDLVCEEQRSIHASLENLDEQSFRDMSEMYYCAFGSENTDSGIANTEDDEYFCFLCSKPNGAQVTSERINSFVLDSIKKGCLYTSNHLHIPRGKEKNKWNYVTSNNNVEFGGLSKSKSEIELPIEYLNYISSDSKKSDLSKRTHQKQHLQENSIGNIKCFLAVTSTLGNSNLRILRSASDSVGLHLSNNTFEVVKLNTDSHDDTLEIYNESPHFLEHASSSRCDYSQMTDRYETQSSATDTEHTTLISSQMLERDDGIGDSNDSFQSYIEALESNAEISSEISRSKSSHSYLNFIKEDSSNNENPFTKRLSSEPFLKCNYENEKSEIQWRETKGNMADILDSATWAEIIESENGLSQSKGKNRGLRRRNTMTCVRDETEKDVNLRCKHTCTEFENYLWNAYKEHLLDNTQSDKEFPTSPHLNYYSLDRKSKFKNRDSKSFDYVNGECSNDFYSVNSTNFQQSFEEDSNESNYATFRNILKHSNVLSQQDRHRNLNRTKSIAGDTLPGSERDDLIRKLMVERKLSQGHNSYDPNNGIRTPFLSNFLNDLEKKEQGIRVDKDARRRHLKNNLPVKRTKSEYKKSFLQLMAMKRIQEAEKELDKVHRNDFQDVEEENSGSLLEALKTHGYKSVISQRFQDTDADSLDPFHTKYLKSPRNRADLARLNYMYYESMPRYNLDSYGENDYIYDDLDYTSNTFNGLATPSFYDTQNDFRQITPKQSIYDWLNTTQSDEYLSTIRSDSLYIPEDTTSSTDARKCCTQWGKENIRSFDDESTSESQDTVEEHISNGTANGISKNKDSIDSSKFTSNTNSENTQLYSTNTEDEKQESVQDRIWRKSFYSRFNNRALSRKERSSFLEPEFLSENRLGLLNNLYNSPKPGYERSEFSPFDGSNKSFKMKRSKKHSSSFKRHESSSNVKQHSGKSSKVRDTGCNETSNSNKDSQTFHRKNTEQELEPEH